MISGADARDRRPLRRALSFDGADDSVTIAASAGARPVDARQTLEAWVRPAALGSWRSVILPRRGDGAGRTRCYASTDAGVPAAHVFTGVAHRRARARAARR